MVFIIGRRMCIPFNQSGHDVELIAALRQGENRAEFGSGYLCCTSQDKSHVLENRDSAMGEDRDGVYGR